MRIKKLIIKNFRQFENLELDFTDENGEVLDVVVFAGVNGSGKSTILNFLSEVFSFFNVSMHPFVLPNSEIIGHFQIQLLSDNQEFEINCLGDKKTHAFVSDNLKDTYKHISSHNQLAINLLHLKDRGYFNLYSSDSNQNLNNIDFGKTEEDILKKISNAVFKNKDKAPKAVIDETINKINKNFITLKSNTRLIDFEADKLIFSNGVKNDLTFDDLSNGEKQLFFQIFTLHNLHLNNGIMLIDEPEDAMHPTWQREILNVYKNIGIDNQVFVATHSPHILSSVKPESLFVLNIDEETGKIQAFNMAKERKNTKGLDPNRILTEIMGAPLRDYETQQRIDDLNALIKAANAAPNGNIQTIEENLQALTTDLGRQDYNIMLFNNELMLLKRKKSKMEVA